METFKEYGSVIILVISLLSYAFSFVVLLAQNKAKNDRISEFIEDYKAHIEDYNKLKNDVAFIKGGLEK